MSKIKKIEVNLASKHSNNNNNNNVLLRIKGYNAQKKVFISQCDSSDDDLNINPDRWHVLRVCVSRDCGSLTKYFGRGDSSGWGLVKRSCMLANNQLPGGPSQRLVVSELGGLKGKRSKNQSVYHPAMSKLLEEYYDVCNAVTIGPGSDIDRLLQEAYNYRR